MSEPSFGDEVMSWEEFPINEVFIWEGAFWMKINNEYILQVKPLNDNGWGAMGAPVKYDPSWRMKLSIASVREVVEVRKKNGDRTVNVRRLIILMCVSIILGLSVLIVALLK